MIDRALREVVWRWRTRTFARAVRSRMQTMVPPPVLRPHKKGGVRLVYRRRSPGDIYLRIFTGRLYASIVGVPYGAQSGLRRTGEEVIHEVSFEKRGQLIRKMRISIGSLVPYAARHEFRPRRWLPYFMPSIEETAEALRDEVYRVYNEHAGGIVRRLVQRLRS